MLSHIDQENNPGMVDVSGKNPTKRTALARSIVVLSKEILQMIQGAEIESKKGPVFQTAIVAGTMGVKKTSELIPFCHPLGIENCRIKIYFNEEKQVVIDCEVSISGKTGVEMEALTGASIAALTIYDMCKSMSQEILIKETRLIKKQGGKSDYHSSH